MFVAGVDGCKSGWIVVALDGGRFAGAARCASFEQVLSATEEAVAIGVDMPIGLVPEGERLCDALTRAFVGPRRSSVFSTPPRAALEATSYAQANERALALWGKKISTQAYNLRDKILEVDARVRAGRPHRPPPSPADADHPARRILEKREDPASLLRYARIIDKRHGATTKPAILVPGMRDGKVKPAELVAGRIVEVHPEASFRQMAGQPLEYSKKSYNGLMMRMRLLEKAGIAIPAELGEVGGVGVDDVLDAAAAAWTAHRYATGQARPLPPAEQWQRDGERIIAIWI